MRKPVRSFVEVQKMAAVSSAPKILQELGRVLTQIMAGVKDVDLSSLPREWAELIKSQT
ncbi:MAG: hypothetical protein HND47_14585 [Chloroflexi bacterium]|nr:hypothetical protein [Chloroflexota bacterium]